MATPIANITLGVAVALAGCGHSTWLEGTGDGDSEHGISSDTAGDDGDNDEGAGPDEAGDASSCLPGAEPALLAPENGAYTGSIHAPPSFGVVRPLLRWRLPDPVPCDSPTFHVQVDDSCPVPGFAECAFASPEAEAADLVGTSWTVAPALPVAAAPPVGRRYYWRVRACCGACCSGWSRVWYIDVGRVRNDLDGDGWSDLIVGAPGGAETGIPPGAVYVVRGAPVLAATVAAIPRVGMPGDEFGAAVAGAGDVNADGFADLLTGAPASDTEGRDAGRAYLWLGGPDLPGEPTLAFTGDDSSGRLGSSVAGAGDVNADGFADLLVGAPHSGVSTGVCAQVFLGGTPLDANADFLVPADPFPPAVGTAVSGVGDVNGDGFSDLLVGIPTEGVRSTGRVKLILGGSEAPFVVARTYEGNAGDLLGSSVSGAGDVNGDGYADMLMGAPTARATAGAVTLRLGSADLDDGRVLVLAADEWSSRFGRSVAGAGDIDGDGLFDFLVGGSGNPDVDHPAGAYLYRGDPVPRDVAELTFAAEHREDSFGDDVAGAGDLNGDGYADIAVGAPQYFGVVPSAGRIYIFLGGPSADPEADLALSTDVAGERFGWSLD